jgi:hypothetical protein
MSIGTQAPAPVAPAAPAKPGLMSRLISDLQAGAATVDADLLKLWNSLPAPTQAMLQTALPMLEQLANSAVVKFATVMIAQAGAAANVPTATALATVSGIITEVETAMAPVATTKPAV